MLFSAETGSKKYFLKRSNIFQVYFSSRFCFWTNPKGSKEVEDIFLYHLLETD